MAELFIPPNARFEYEKRVHEWGESGPAHNVGNIIKSTQERTLIVKNHTLNVPRNAMEQQKQRTFTNNNNGLVIVSSPHIWAASSWRTGIYVGWLGGSAD